MRTIIDLYRRLQTWAQAWRNPIRTIAAVLFIGALFLSIQHSGVGLDDLRIAPLLVLAVVLVPLQTAYSAINTVVMGKAAGGPVRFLAAVRVNIYAQLAELLPIPGGAIVRTGALIQAGATVLRSAEVVATFSIFWIACGAIGAGVALTGSWLGCPLIAAGAAVLIVTGAWSSVRFGAKLVITAIALRLVGLGIVAARILTAFAAIGVTIDVLSGLCFGFASILGGAASLVPAGLGVSEALAALFAGPVGVEPSAAFLAVAVSRMVAFAVHSAAALALGSLNGLFRILPAIERR